MTDAGLEVRGGVGGTAARLDRLREGVRRLRAAADLLDAAAGSVAWADAQLGAPAGVLPTAVRAQHAVTPLVRGPTSFTAHQQSVHDLARRLRDAARAYEDAEARAGAHVRGLLAVGAHQAADQPLLTGLRAAVLTVLATGLLPTALAASIGLRLSGRRVDLRRALLRTDLAELAVQAMAGAAGGLPPGRGQPTVVPVPRASGLVTTGAALGGLVVPSLRRRPLQVIPRLRASPRTSAPDDAGDVLDRIGALYPQGGGAAGTVGVDRIDHPDGTRSWVVSIPGTQDGSMGTGPNPLDMATNLRLMAAVPDDSSELVERALEQAGARSDEPILLAGHSQGGMVAMALAGSATFTQRFRVAAVLTAGSPVATMPVPTGTAALHLEHRQDLVPALDGWRNPDRANRTTAVRDLGVSPAVADRVAARSPAAAHEIAAYARTARAVSDAGGSSVRAWERAAAEVLGGPGSTAVHLEFTGERTPPDGPVHAPGAEQRGLGVLGPGLLGPGLLGPGLPAPGQREPARAGGPTSAGSPR
ncbi:hypothetical protein [uncultured Cellulomonas sp.]|uniref:PGAP1-like alpha/beta domain-containing protein n=1 Tax=uncultured Cellulomonas sp. TaxID=189682 RepID=UPI002609134E|nr:hypothetical protein [uncultured Cellulomonas sp.]